MKRMGAGLVVSGGLWLLGSGSLHAEIVRCAGADGKTVYTNAARGLSNCSPYESRAHLGVVSGRGPAERPAMRTVRHAQKEAVSVRDPAKPAPSGSRALPKEVSFEVMRMLSPGMSKAEVLRLAGSPRHELKNKGSRRWVYDATDRWIVEIVFSGNKVAAIDWSRT